MAEHSRGPWRWEVNRQSKSIHLVGGRPMFDKTVMDFGRWGMQHAAPRFNSAIAGGEFNIMYAPHEHDGWVVPFVEREHHAHWCANVNHPDARLIAAAPDLLEALLGVVAVADRNTVEFDRARAAIAKATVTA